MTLRYGFDFFQETDVNRVWGRVYYCSWQGEIYLQQEEVAWGGFMSSEEIQTFVKKGRMTPDAILILSRLDPSFLK